MGNQFGLGERERSIISGGNALRLLGIDETSKGAQPAAVAGSFGVGRTPR